MSERSITTIFQNGMNIFKAKVGKLRTEYGIWGCAAAIAVLLKLLLFYHLIGVKANFFFVWLITSVLTYLLFASFKNKWIPAVVFTLITVLMFCDLTYASFFNRYLSVTMMGAAGVLGDITASIKEVLKPWFFLLLPDVALVYAALGLRLHKRRNFKAESVEEAENAAEASENTSIPENISIPENTSTDDDHVETGNGSVYEAETADRVIARRKRKAQREKKERLERWLKNHKNPVAALLILFLLVFNFTGSYFITSLSNQEIYSFHIKDVVNAAVGNNAAGDFKYAFTDSYEQEKNGPLFGVAKGRNLIVIQIESMQNLVINKTYNGQELTPNLNQIIKDNSVYFDHYYQQIGSGNTSDAEFATNNSIYGTLSSFTYKLYDDNYFRGLPKLLKEQGYESAVYHAHEDRNFWNRENAYYSIGFDTYYGGIGGTDKGQFDMTEWMGWGLTDSEFFKQSMNYLKDMTQPFYSFIITLSNHHPYEMLDKYQFIDLLPEDKGTIFGNYLNSVAYTDYALGQLMQELKDAGLYDNSIIAFYGDHMGLPKTDDEIHDSVSRFLGKDYDFDTMMSIPLIITVPGAEQNINQTVGTVGGQLDFLPTIAYLMGFDSLDTVYLGHNLLTIDSGFVAEQTYMTKGSFFSDDVAYEMSRDGVFENGRAWNTKTGESVPVEECYDGYMRSMGIVNTSEYILKNDVLRKIYLEGQDVGSAFSEKVVAEYPHEIAIAGAPDQSLLGTNSREALDASYDAGYRNIQVQICWTKDKEAVLLKSWKELGNYFDTERDEEITLEMFQSLKMKDGLSSMDYLDLISWMKKHPDAVILARAERSSDYFMKSMGSYAGSIMDQFISEVPGMMEYTGLYHSILNIDIGGNTVDQLLEFIKLNQVPAVVMSKASAEGPYKKVLNADCISYVLNNTTGIMKRSSN